MKGLKGPVDSIHVFGGVGKVTQDHVLSVESMPSCAYIYESRSGVDDNMQSISTKVDRE